MGNCVTGRESAGVDFPLLRTCMQRVLAVLLRPTCVSLAVSNHYVSLADPLGALMLREVGPKPPSSLSSPAASTTISGSAPSEASSLPASGSLIPHEAVVQFPAVPRQTLLRMLRGVSDDLDGVVWGAEHLKYAQVMQLSQLQDLADSPESRALQRQQLQTRAVQREIACGYSVYCCIT
eukprot:272975-Pelagomonas_calceolata.AAC.1